MYRILIDSCGELFPEMQNTESFCNVPLTLTVDSHEIIDDETFNQAEFLRMIKESANAPKSACPSPDAAAAGTFQPPWFFPPPRIFSAPSSRW